MKNPLVSFICPFKNEIGVLEASLQSYINQTYKPIEIILVDSDSTDGSSEVAKAYAQTYSFVHYYNIPSVPGRWATRFYVTGMEFAKGDYIYMADANAKLGSDDYLALCMKHFSDPHVAGVVGKVRIWDTKRWIAKFRHVLWTLRFDNVSRIEKEISLGGILPRIFSRRAFDAVGGFNEDAGWAVDTFFNRRLLAKKYTLVYEPRAVWYHQWRDDPIVLLKYSYTFGKLNVDLIKTESKQMIKIIYFLLFPLFVIASFFDTLFLYFVLGHILILFLKYFFLFLRAKGVKHRWYAFAGIFVGYLQGLPYAFGSVVGSFRRLY